MNRYQIITMDGQVWGVTAGSSDDAISLFDPVDVAMIELTFYGKSD